MGRSGKKILALGRLTGLLPLLPRLIADVVDIVVGRVALEVVFVVWMIVAVDFFNYLPRGNYARRIHIVHMFFTPVR